MTVARRRPAEEASTRGPEAKLSLDHAKSIQKQRLYREWGVASVRAVARIKIEGLGLIGAPSSIPRPNYGRDAAAKRARDAAYARAARGTGGTFGVAYEQ